MFAISDLICLFDAYKTSAGVTDDARVSYRVFSDSKKLAALRKGGEITVGRFNSAVLWFGDNWPKDKERPALLSKMLAARMSKSDAA